MSGSEEALLDADGNPADRKAEFELRRKVIGRVVKGVRFCSNEDYKFVDGDGVETVKRGSTLILAFEDGGDLIVAVPETGGIELFLANQSNPYDTPDDWVSSQKVN